MKITLNEYKKAKLNYVELMLFSLFFEVTITQLHSFESYNNAMFSNGKFEFEKFTSFFGKVGSNDFCWFSST